MKESIAIEASYLTKKYSSRILFSEISFTVKAGECLGITGYNGSGKGTLLKIIAGIVQPSSGSIKISCGNADLDAEEKLLYMGMVSPEMQLYDALSGYENIILLSGSRGLKITTSEAARVCDRIGLGLKGAELVKTYSTGMKQRLKIGLLLGIDAPVWLLDEPSSNLDREGKKIVLETIGTALEQGKHIILASNDEAEVLYAQKTIALS